MGALLLIQASKNEVRYQIDYCRYSLGHAGVCLFYISLLPGMAYGMGSYHGKDQIQTSVSITCPLFFPIDLAHGSDDSDCWWH
jgi:hypothetical protein